MKNPLKIVKQKALPVTRKMHMSKLKFKKNSPNIAFGVGIIGVGVGTVWACKQTLRLPETLDYIEKDLEAIRGLRAEAESGNQSRYPVENLGRDTAYVYAKSAYKLGRLYAGPLAVSVVSVGLLTHSHVNLTRRNASLMAAYAAVAKAYDDYRQRIIDELGEDRELEIYHAKVEMEPNEAGQVFVAADPNTWSPYARFFDEASPNWVKNAEYNRLFIQCQQNYANNLLQARGHLFLNEVYDMLGIERSQAGQVVGWVIGENGDNYVDFGMYEATNAQFINGTERSVVLDFNVDGVIYDKI